MKRTSSGGEGVGATNDQNHRGGGRQHGPTSSRASVNNWRRLGIILQIEHVHHAEDNDDDSGGNDDNKDNDDEDDDDQLRLQAAISRMQPNQPFAPSIDNNVHTSAHLPSNQPIN